MKLIYFDRNVFADICELRRGLTEGDVNKVQQAVQSQSIMIPVSTTLLQETLAVLSQSDEKYNQHIKTVFGLVDKDWMVKSFDDLLIDHCYSFAENKICQELIPTARDLKDIFDLSKNKAELISVAEQSMQWGKDRASKLTEGLLTARVKGEANNIGTPDDFLELWNALSKSTMESILDKVPRPIRRLCKKRGLNNMLKIKCFRIYAIYYVWLIHSGWFGVQGKPRKVKDSDIRDFHHAVKASVADIFVTEESKQKINKLPFILSQIAIPNFKIVSLREFLDAL